MHRRWTHHSSQTPTRSRAATLISVRFVFSWHVLWVEGYSLHPAIGEAVAADVVLDEHLGMIQIPGSTHTYSGLAKKVVYHLDLHSQFIDLSGFESRFPPPGQPHTMPRTDQSARCQMALDAFRSNASPTTFFSLPRTNFFSWGSHQPAQHMKLTPLLDTVGASSRALAGGCDFEFESDGVSAFASGGPG